MISPKLYDLSSRERLQVVELIIYIKINMLSLLKHLGPQNHTCLGPLQLP